MVGTQNRLGLGERLFVQRFDLARGPRGAQLLDLRKRGCEQIRLVDAILDGIGEPDEQSRAFSGVRRGIDGRREQRRMIGRELRRLSRAPRCFRQLSLLREKLRLRAQRLRALGG